MEFRPDTGRQGRVQPVHQPADGTSSGPRLWTSGHLWTEGAGAGFGGRAGGKDQGHREPFDAIRVSKQGFKSAGAWGIRLSAFLRRSAGGQDTEGHDVAHLVAGFVYGGFGDEGRVGKAVIVEQAAEGFGTDGAFADVLVAVEL